MGDSIIVTEYDPLWPRVFDGIRVALLRALEGVRFDSIEHVGSTAVPGLAAKPIIDIDVVVAASAVDAAVQALVARGYESLGDMGIADRYALRAPAGAPRQNVYVVVRDSLALRNHLGVRKVLREDAMLRDEYGSVKVELAQQFDDIELYVAGKTHVLQRILQAAGLDQADLDEIDWANRA